MSVSHLQNYVQGPTCDQCKSHTFHLHPENQFGCVSCFCMGVTDDCQSSSLYRDSVSFYSLNSQFNNTFKTYSSSRSIPYLQALRTILN